ncbi:MAG: hypothetical protein WBG08_02365 [Litorimonas sp.]
MPRDIPALMEEAEAKGFAHHFETQAKGLYCRETQTAYELGQIQVVDTLFKDAGTDPGDEATLYLLEAADGTKGMLLIGNPASLSAPERAVLRQLTSG